MNVDRYITGLLILCFSVFLGHNLVPHYHLSELNCAPFSTTCPSDQGELDHQRDEHANAGKHHAHCHAFNDVILDKFNPIDFNPGPVQWHHMEIPGPEWATDASLLLPPIPFTFQKLTCNSSTDIGTQALRAPPSLG